MMWLVLTIFVFLLSLTLARRIQNPFCNPLLISLAILLPCLFYSGNGYQQYAEDTKVLTNLLNLAVIALAYPLYKHSHQIRKNWRLIGVSCVIASFLSAFTGALIALCFSHDNAIAASVFPKSISTPFAIETASMLGGFPPIATALVVIAGLFGVIFGYPLFRVLKIRSPIARGIAMGAISHALGVVKANEISHKEGAFSSLALVICGIFTVLVAPWLFEWVQWCFLNIFHPHH